MDLRKVKKLIELLEASNIAEIEIHEGEESVRISRASRAAPQQQVVEAASLAAAPATPGAEPAPAPAEPEEPEGHLVTAPMVGTFYGAPAPGSPPYVEPGSRVERGEVLCIIEAMKIMNPIESDSAGIVRAVLVDNGQPVEYGQPLFVLEES